MTSICMRFVSTSSLNVLCHWGLQKWRRNVLSGTRRLFSCPVARGTEQCVELASPARSMVSVPYSSVKSVFVGAVLNVDGE